MPVEYPAFIVDAFAPRRFTGNQAAVCLIDKKLTDAEYQKLGAEFNLSETAIPLPLDNGMDFKTGKRFSLRWFTPTVEVALCGHATLATAHVLFNEMGNENAEIEFQVQLGKLVVQRSIESVGMISMDFPQHELCSIAISHTKSVGLHQQFPMKEDSTGIIDSLVKTLIPDHLHVAGVVYAPKVNYLIILMHDTCTKDDFMSIGANRLDDLVPLDPEGKTVRMISITVNCHEFVQDNGMPYDFVSRTFAPWSGIREDPATGSAHCGLGPFWSQLSNKHTMKAFQAHPGRGAEFRVSMKAENRIELIGKAVTIVRGKLCL